ncbi:hypothetical protein K438DRAFT_1841649 [Mycena galopus ATCC 62051]|nr:hypothetical protein K438DRAFT_1841649 [Mycena galopus ATCC 62051]
MRALTSLPFDDDLVHLIMTFCTSFDALENIALVSKTFYRVYQTHPKSIAYAVAANVVGPALPQALRVIRYPYPADRKARDEQGEEPLAKACPEGDMIAASGITVKEEHTLYDNMDTVQTLEDIYSLSQKDRTSNTSVLTPAESHRFQRAVYRIMFYCTLFSSDIDDSEEDVRLIRRQRAAVLSKYPTDELRELYAVVQFMREIMREQCDEDLEPGLIDLLLTSGPNGAVRVWEDQSYERIDDLDFGRLDEQEDVPLYEGYFALALKSVWDARGVDAPNDAEPASKWILDTVIGADDTCSQCAAPGGLALLTEANWDRLYFSPFRYLKGELKNNKAVKKLFEDVEYMERHELGPWISGIFAFAASTKANSTQTDTKTKTTGGSSEWDGWEIDHSYCRACLDKFLDGNVWRWFLAKQIKGGWVPPEDCCDGYDCKTMVAHAEGKNHLCVPTTGVAQWT